MSKKHTIEEKTKVLDTYIKRPISIEHPEVLRSIKTDVLKANTPKTKKASESGSKLYNECMGIYRQFVSSQGSHLKLDGKKARIYKEAMDNLIGYIRSGAKANGKPSDDAAVKKGLEYIFRNWDALNDWHRGRIGLPDIYSTIEEIIIQIKNHHGSSKNASTGEGFGKL